MSERLGKALLESSFATLEDAKRFIQWFREPGQIVSEWDKTRYLQATDLLAILNGEGS